MSIKCRHCGKCIEFWSKLECYDQTNLPPPTHKNHNHADAPVSTAVSFSRFPVGLSSEFSHLKYLLRYCVCIPTFLKYSKGNRRSHYLFYHKPLKCVDLNTDRTRQSVVEHMVCQIDKLY